MTPYYEIIVLFQEVFPKPCKETSSALICFSNCCTVEFPVSKSWLVTMLVALLTTLPPVNTIEEAEICKHMSSAV